MSLHHFVREQIILPLSDLLNHQHVYHHMQILRHAESWDEKKIQEFQEQRLHEMVKYAVEEVPFYRDWFESHTFDLAHMSLEQLPIVDKNLMRREGINRFTAEHFPARDRMETRSSGSTGEPFSFYVSKEAYSVNLAAKLHTWYQAGYRLGDRYTKLAYVARPGWKKQLQDRFNNCQYVFFDSLDDKRLFDISTEIEKFKPLFLRSYPMTLFMLARYRMKHPEFSHRLKRVFTTGATLTDVERKVIENAFGCDVIDSYSCEGNPNNAETPCHDGYHTCRYYGIVEVLDEEDRKVVNGIGRVIGTDFWNKAHPFLRYDTHDLVEVENGVIKRVLGRQSESILSSTGVVFTIYSFMSFFEHATEAVDAYQVLRHTDNTITFRLVVNAKFTPDTQNYIVHYWQDQLGMPVTIELVDEIPLMHNNKHLAIINE